MTEYEKLREKIKLAFCMNNTCYPFCTFQERDCPQAKVATRELLTIIAEWLKNRPSEGALIDRLRYQKGGGLLTPEGQRFFASKHYETPYKLGKELYDWLQRVQEIKPPVLSEQKSREKCLGKLLD